MSSVSGPEGVVVGLRRRRGRPVCACGWKPSGACDSRVRNWRHLDRRLGLTQCTHQGFDSAWLLCGGVDCRAVACVEVGEGCLYSAVVVVVHVEVECVEHVGHVGLDGFGRLNPPGVSGDFGPWEGWSHVREIYEAVPGGVEGAGGADGRRAAG